MATFTPTPQQFPQWEFDLLKALGAPDSVNNLTALNLWAQSEGNVINNPLATSGQGVGASTCVAQCGSSSPIYEYSSESAGVAQMAHFLQGSYYTGIVHAFQQDAGLAAIFQAVNSSPWCKGCQNGRYPEALAAAVGGSGQGVSSGVGTGGSTGSGGGGTGGGGSGGAATAGSGLSACVLQFPGFLFFSGPCLLTKGGVKWLSGVAALLGGTALAAFGLVALAAWGFDASGAKGAVTRAAGVLPGPVGSAVRASGASSVSGRASSSVGSRPARARPVASPSSSAPATAGRLESRDIERQYRETVRQQGPIGPRGSSPTSRRVAFEQRRGVSVPGAGRPRTPEQIRRARARAAQPF